jgi:hypothetical protein
MANYIFESYGQVEMSNPNISIHKVHDDYNGSADVYILISLGAPQSNASRMDRDWET